MIPLSTAILAAGDWYPHPVVSPHGAWAGVLWLLIGGLLLAAAVIGPIVRANLPEEITPHSHDEPWGTSHPPQELDRTHI